MIWQEREIFLHAYLLAVFSLAEINMDVPEPSIPWYSSPTFYCRDEE